MSLNLRCTCGELRDAETGPQRVARRASKETRGCALAEGGRRVVWAEREAHNEVRKYNKEERLASTSQSTRMARILSLMSAWLDM